MHVSYGNMAPFPHSLAGGLRLRSIALCKHKTKHGSGSFTCVCEIDARMFLEPR